MNTNIREIPYNYTSFSDREIVIRFLGEEVWEILNKLRSQRRTGRSARMLFTILGDMWVIKRNPYIQDDLLNNKKRREQFYQAIQHKLNEIKSRADNNPDAIKLIKHAETAIGKFKTWLDNQQNLRRKLTLRLGKHTGKNNILFDGLSRVSHVTDASDWRVEYPCVVLTPETELEIAKLIAECVKLDMNIIPRGGGTGYTGGAVPMSEKTAVINTEKIDFISEVTSETLDGHTKATPVISAGAGAITVNLSQAAAKWNLIFAVDPTSQDSSTIGGNIAMNAGGKKAVMWGTTLDNLVSWDMVLADGKTYRINRLNHNLGKIHETGSARFEIIQLDKKKGKTIELKPEETRKPGLGKDVTNKLLGKLPGVQKEGCDGIITQAKFILHPKPKYTHTLCLEFFNPDLHQSVPAIVEIIDLIKDESAVDLVGLEHLDSRYIKAIGYSTKSARAELPNMLLLADIAGNDETILAKISTAIIKLIKDKKAESFIATTNKARQSFWADRKRTAAIAAHTNAFKINEDVVIPLKRLADYADFIERINIEQSINNKLEIIASYQRIISVEAENHSNRDELGKIRLDKLAHTLNRLDNHYRNWQQLLAKLDMPSDNGETYFRRLQNKSIVVSLRKAVKTAIDETLTGNEWADLRDRLHKSHQKHRNRRIFVATHMHAGDGNVHTNIPVHSNDYQMLTAADKIVDRIMQTALELGGSISGEHGIGLTKIKYLQPENIADFEKYKSEIDKNHNFNRGKLSAKSGLDNAYTPSFRLLELEAILLENSELGKLNNSIKDCLRCGKCKPLCSTHVPRANLLYSPRNKILASGLLIEAFLYEEQTKRGIARNHFTELNDIADHCTVCHRCLAPCPVNIDFGEVTINIRSILKKQGKRKFNPGNFIAMLFLNITDARLINIWRKLLVNFGYSLQRKLSTLIKAKLQMPHTTGRSTLNQQVVNFIKTPLPKDLPNKSMRSFLGIEAKDEIPLIRTQDSTSDKAVLYFPGCGSERLFSQIGLGVIKWLLHLNVSTVLPPGYLCCGYPQLASGDEAKGNKIITDNIVLLHRMARALSFLNIEKIIVSCGTCLDQLLQYELGKLFPNAELMDIHEYLYEQGINLGTNDKKYLLHDPCHSPDKKHEPVAMAQEMLAGEVMLSDRCCGESGTFAVARADISTQVKSRKLEEIELNRNELKLADGDKILTTCPSCLQGLGRGENQHKLKADYLLLEMANLQFGVNWQQKLITQLSTENIEKIIL